MSKFDTVGYTPVIRILKGDDDITAPLEDRAVSITITSRSGVGNGDRLELVLDDRDYAIEAPVTDGPDTATLAVALGFRETGIFDMGTFEVDECNYLFAPRSIRLVGNSLGFTSGAKSPIIAAHEEQTLGAIVAEIAAAAGVRAAVSANLADRVIPYRNQHASAMHELQELERNYNALGKFGDGMLSFTERGSGLSVSGAKLDRFDITEEDFGAYTINETARTSFSTVRASYWDKAQAQVVWLQSQAKGRSSAPPFMIKKGFASKQEAQAAADAKMASLNRGIKTGSLTLAKGNPAIKGGAPFTISNIRDGVDGTYITDLATHTYTKDAGLMTTLSFYSVDDNVVLDEMNSASQPDFTSQGQIYGPLGQGGIGHR